MSTLNSDRPTAIFRRGAASPLNLVLLFMLMFAPRVTQGASFEIGTSSVGNYQYDVISIVGDIQSGDLDKFLALAFKSKRDVLVRLDSKGGDLATALDIGRLISARGYSTSIIKYDCISACALIWLAGKDRYLQDGERLGFHSAFKKTKSGQREPDQASNALIGAYIRQLELPSAVASLVVEADPNSVTWVTIKNASDFGIMTRRGVDIESHDLHDRALISKDPKTAALLYREAANRGFAGSQNNLGDIYESGRGVLKKNEKVAVYWYTRAAERGEPYAYWSLFSILMKDSPDAQSTIEAVKFGLLAIEHLPDGADREKARKDIRALKAVMPAWAFKRAVERARTWVPLFEEQYTMQPSTEP